MYGRSRSEWDFEVRSREDPLSLMGVRGGIVNRLSEDDLFVWWAVARFLCGGLSRASGRNGLSRLRILRARKKHWFHVRHYESMLQSLGQYCF